MKRLLLSLLLVATIACGGTATEERPTPVRDPGVIASRIARVENALLPAITIKGEPVRTASLEERMAYHRVPAVSVAVISGGEIEWAEAWGMADVEEGRPATTETLFQAASISKPVAAMAALKLVDEGILDLDGDVNEKLLSWQVPTNEHNADSPITLRRLVTHTAGMTVHGFPGYAKGAEVPDTVGVLDGEGNTDPIRVDTRPGRIWRYSGGGYTVMQLLVSDVTDRPFPEVLRETVLEPLGMEHSTYAQPLPETRTADAASAYRENGKKVEGDWHIYPEMAAAGLWTTPSDLARYAIAIQRANALATGSSGSVEGQPHPVLSAEMVTALLIPDKNDWGLGPSLSPENGRFGHGGSNAGFRCTMTAYLDRGQGVVVMTNSDTGASLYQEIIATLADEYGWEDLLAEEREVVELAPAILQRYVGRYVSVRMGEVAVSLEEDRLWITVPWGATLELLAESETEFFVREDGTRVEFGMEDGRVLGLQWAGSVRAQKVE